MTMKGAELLVKSLENEGVKRIFGIPGEENLDLMDALIDSNIEFVVTRHESGAAFIAGMIGRLTKKPGVCLTTLGPGASNLPIGVAEAYLSYYPMVAMSGQIRVEHQHHPRKQFVDLVSMFRPITKESISIRNAGRIADLTRRAFDTAAQERPGPVFLELPEDVLKEQTDHMPVPVTRHEIMGSDIFNFERLRRYIDESQHPIILAGGGVVRGVASEALLCFASNWNIPAAMTWTASGALPFDDALSLGTIGLRKADIMRAAFERSDLVILVGYDLIEFEPQYWNFGKPKKIVYIGAVPCETAPGFHPDLQIIGSVRKILTSLSTDPDKRKTWASDFKEKYTSWLNEVSSDDNHLVKPQNIIKAIRNALGREDIAISDVGAHLIWMAQRYPVYKENTMLVSNGLIPMGVGIPWAIAAKLTYPERKVVTSVGDGSFLMSSMELETAKRLDTPFVTVVWNDSSLDLIRIKQEKAFGGGRNIGTEFSNPDLVKYAQSFGVEGYKVSSKKELGEKIAEYLRDEALAVIEVPVDQRENNRLTPS
jgi:acetolactate synthase-1/2/3 large subunit